MTREEAKTNLNMIRVAFGVPVTKEQKELVEETFEMAIQALSQEPTVDEMEREYEKSKALFHKIVESDDAISRDAVIKLFNGNIGSEAALILHMVKQLPSVTQKSGKWIKVTNGRGGHECSLCHEYAPSYQNGEEWLTKFCPKCGHRMVEPQESEDKCKNCEYYHNPDYTRCKECGAERRNRE